MFQIHSRYYSSILLNQETEDNFVIQNDLQLQPSNLLTLIEQIPQSESELSKLEIVKQIELCIKQLCEGNPLIEISIDFCKQSLQLIDDVQSDVQKRILGVVLSIAELGSDIVEQHEVDNYFFQVFNESGLLQKIEILLNQEQKDQKEDDYSEHELILTQILALIKRRKYIKKELHGSALQAVGELIEYFNRVDKYLLESHAAFKHIIPIIFSFVRYKISLNQDILKFRSEQTNTYLPKLSDADGALNVLFGLLSRNQNLCDYAAFDPCIVFSLKKLIKLDRQRSGLVRNDAIAARIRINSNFCMYCLFRSEPDDLRVQRKKVQQLGFAQLQIEILSNFEENHEIIYRALFSIGEFFMLLNGGHICFSCMEDIEKDSCEGVEADGGIEVIDQYQYNHDKTEYTNVKVQAKESLNFACHLKNNSVFEWF
ncbi:MAG: hypothetical protein EZS28_008855 [Streblomastix strix]|uniref:Uncharacterized protein n=1 Tax=Streblomastix strix TaxID=222440 RepID=A0A5J4WKP2_9EUKA|nr:MAG: hypothetical protein EZS28_008855 [Streblomastix strix]